jgi:hypothetical protein
MLYPTLCIDNFFQNPDSVIDFSKTLEFKKGDGTWPGKRTLPLHMIDNNFFQKTTSKIMASLYPNEIHSRTMQWSAAQYFQKIKTNEHLHPGYIHQDLEDEFTSIIYLSDEEDAGTAIFKIIKEPIPIYEDIKIKNYLSKKKSKDFFKSIKDNRECFQQTFEFTSLKNRMVLFDSFHFHAVNNFGKKQKERLTLITFFKSICRRDGQGLRFHVNECING